MERCGSIRVACVCDGSELSVVNMKIRAIELKMLLLTFLLLQKNCLGLIISSSTLKIV